MVQQKSNGGQRNPIKQHTEVHNQNLGTGIQQTGMSRMPNEVSLSMPSTRGKAKVDFVYVISLDFNCDFSAIIKHGW